MFFTVDFTFAVPVSLTRQLLQGRGCGSFFFLIPSCRGWQATALKPNPAHCLFVLQVLSSSGGFYRWRFATDFELMIGNTNFEPQLSKILPLARKNFILLISRPILQKVVFSYFYILNFVNKKFVEMCWKTNLLCKYLYNILNFASWPA